MKLGMHNDFQKYFTMFNSQKAMILIYFSLARFSARIAADFFNDLRRLFAAK